MKVPLRYSRDFAAVQVDTEPIVMTAMGPRAATGWRWKCQRCGQLLKPNTAGAQSHVAKHLTELSRRPASAVEGE